MSPKPRRRLTSRRSRPLAGFGATYGFLSPTPRHVEDERRFRERLREDPRMRREYRTSLVLQIVVVGILFVALVVLGVQSVSLLKALRTSAVGPVAWAVPALAAFLALAVLRRFLRVVSEYRRFGRD
jgi:hypothetical protein